jgi:NADP-reducing hydrogenase subunit HndB
MKKIQSLEDLQQSRDAELRERQQKASRGEVEVIVSLGSCGVAAGALDVLHTLQEQIRAHDLENITLSQTGCIGLCSYEPILEVIVGEAPKVTYGRVVPDAVKRIIREHVLEGKVVEEFAIDATPFPTI